MSEAEQVRIKLVRSPIGSSERQRRTVRSLGLRRLGQVVVHRDSPTLRGMIDRVRHLVSVVDS